MFQVHGADERGKAVQRKALKRAQVLSHFGNLPPCLIGMEACAGAHYWARELAKLGHTVKLIAPQFVKPYVKGNQNDANDAEAICEAVGRPNMRFVPVKSVEQQDLQALQRVRSGLVKERTAKVNQVRGLLGEYGLVIGQGVAPVRRRLPELLEDAENGLSRPARELFADLHEQIVKLDEQVAVYPSRIERICQASAACRKLTQIKGIGPLTATALVAAVGDGSAFDQARQVPAWIGLTPRQDSSGGCWASASGAIAICAPCSSMAGGPWSRPPRARTTPKAAGSTTWSSGATRTSLRWRSPTRMPGSPGRCYGGRKTTA